MKNDSENLQQALKQYINNKHNQDQCVGFIAGFEAAQEIYLKKFQDNGS